MCRKATPKDNHAHRLRNPVEVVVVIDPLADENVHALRLIHVGRLLQDAVAVLAEDGQNRRVVLDNVLLSTDLYLACFIAVSRSKTM